MVFRHQPLTLIVAVGTVVLTVVLYIVIPKGFFPVQDNGLIQAITEAPQSVSFDAMSERQRALADVILNDPDVESLTSFVGVDGTNPTLNSGRMLINLKPRDARTLSASQIIRRIQRETASLQGITLYMQPSQDLSIDSTVSRTQYQFVLESPNPDDFDVWVPRLMDRMAQIPRDHRRRHRAAEQGPGDVHQDRPRRGGALRHHRGHGRQPALRRLRPAHRLDGLHPVEPVPRDLRGRAADGPQPRLALQPLSAGLDRRQAGAAVRDRHLRGAHRAAQARSAEPVPGHHRLLQPGAGRLARPGGRRHRRGAEGDRHAAADPDPLPGRGARLPEGARQPADADPGGDRHGLHRAGRALRELHPSDHDPVDPAVGRHRRAAGADDGRRRSQRRRHHRHRAADRHRQEERDHDDRLRARRRAQRGQGAAGGDPPGLPAALPADPDDDHRRPGRRAAADAGHRHRLGAAPSARPHHRRRPDRQPDADPVHHAGDLPRLRPARPAPARHAARHAGLSAGLRPGRRRRAPGELPESYQP